MANGDRSPARTGALRYRGMHAMLEHDGVSDAVAVEEPLEIRIDGAPLAVAMRTPGDDEDLAAGFLFGEGLVATRPEVGPSEDLAANVVEVRGPLARDPGRRSFYATSSCGVCGKGALEEVAVSAEPLADGPVVERALLAALPERLRQPEFERTGGLHATGLFGPDGGLLAVREDVSRHNAMDKVIGWALAEGIVPLHPRLLGQRPALLRAGPEGGRGGGADLGRVGAPTSLAVSLAADRELTLCGFARDDAVNVYTRPDRVRGAA